MLLFFFSGGRNTQGSEDTHLSAVDIALVSKKDITGFLFS